MSLSVFDANVPIIISRSGRFDCFLVRQNAETESLNSFFDIAIGAIEIMEHCTSLADGESVTKLVNGQQFFRDGWNVIINAADC